MFRLRTAGLLVNTLCVYHNLTNYTYEDRMRSALIGQTIKYLILSFADGRARDA